MTVKSKKKKMPVVICKRDQSNISKCLVLSHQMLKTENIQFTIMYDKRKELNPHI